MPWATKSNLRLEAQTLTISTGLARLAQQPSPHSPPPKNPVPNSHPGGTGCQLHTGHHCFRMTQSSGGGSNAHFGCLAFGRGSRWGGGLRMGGGAIQRPHAKPSACFKTGGSLLSRPPPPTPAAPIHSLLLLRGPDPAPLRIYLPAQLDDALQPRFVPHQGAQLCCAERPEAQVHRRAPRAPIAVHDAGRSGRAAAPGTRSRTCTCTATVGHQRAPPLLLKGPPYSFLSP